MYFLTLIPQFSNNYNFLFINELYIFKNLFTVTFNIRKCPRNNLLPHLHYNNYNQFLLPEKLESPLVWPEYTCTYMSYFQLHTGNNMVYLFPFSSHSQ